MDRGGTAGTAGGASAAGTQRHSASSRGHRRPAGVGGGAATAGMAAHHMLPGRRMVEGSWNTTWVSGTPPGFLEHYPVIRILSGILEHQPGGLASKVASKFRGQNTGEGGWYDQAGGRHFQLK